jgi:hypothetical protein
MDCNQYPAAPSFCGTPQTKPMKSLRKFAVLAACLISVAAFAADPSGTWTFAGGFGGGRRGGGAGGAPDGAPPPQNTLVLTLKDGKLTGKLTPPGRGGPGEPIEIKDASIKDDVVSFSIERPGRDGGPARVTKYSGKLAGDTITGKSEGPGRGGEVMSNDWVAKKSK